MIPHQVFNATLLGLVLGAICIRTRSLFPGVAFHFVYNSIGVLHDRLSEYPQVVAQLTNGAVGQYLFRWQDNSLRYQPFLLVILGLVCAGLLTQLLKTPSIPILNDSVSHSNAS
jgi:sodium transport system permease protein